MSKPQLTVVIPAVNTLDDLVGCLNALVLQRNDCDVEILVVNRLGDSVRENIEGHFANIKFIPVDSKTTIPEMRALAFDHALGENIAVIEDHVIVPPGWARSMLGALNPNIDIVGGSVENAATQTLLDWAAFLCEYSHCIPPLQAGVVPWLTGNNVIYRRELLERHKDVIAEGKWENHLHDAIKSDGTSLICHPEIVIGHKKHYTFAEYMSQRYLYARSYAGARVVDAPMSKRIFYGCAAFILPPMLFYRIVTRILSKGRHKKLLYKSLPLISLFVTSWAVGEVVGYWVGPGNSLSKVC